MQGNVLNWLGVVVDSAICGCKNGSSLPVRKVSLSAALACAPAGYVWWLSGRLCLWRRRFQERLTSAKPFLWNPRLLVPAAVRTCPRWHDLCMVFGVRPWP